MLASCRLAEQRQNDLKNVFAWAGIAFAFWFTMWFLVKLIPHFRGHTDGKDTALSANRVLRDALQSNNLRLVLRYVGRHTKTRQTANGLVSLSCQYSRRSG